MSSVGRGNTARMVLQYYLNCFNVNNFVCVEASG